MKRYKLNLQVEINKEYTVDADSRDEAEQLAFSIFREEFQEIKNNPNIEVDFWGKFLEEEEINGSCSTD